jgi:hypothetical protein
LLLVNSSQDSWFSPFLSLVNALGITRLAHGHFVF